MKHKLLHVAVYCLAVFATVAGSRADIKIDFGSGKPQPGDVQVSPNAAYSSQVGYGFEPGSEVQSAGACIVAEHPFYFSVAAAEGNYKVTVKLGDPNGISQTTIKAELRRLMVLGARTQQGETVTRSFIVNVRNPQYPGGKVHLKSPRETTNEAWAWDDKLTLEFNGKRPCVQSIEVEKVEVPTVFILGDSTVCDQSAEPYASWGQMLPVFFKPDIAIANHAESGETVRSSTNAHRLDKVLSLMKPGDYLLMQFGHNDMKEKNPGAIDEYEAALKQWCEKVKAKGGIPVLITPMNRHSFKGNEVINSLGEYPARVRSAAKAEGVALIDLNAMSKSLYEALGPTPSIALFEHVNADKFDQTHHSPYGAYELAKCVVEGIRQDKLDLAGHLVDGLPAFDPSKPDTEDQVRIPPSPAVTTQRPLGD
jgi:lysophospholipase L1-like esterase